MLFSNLQMNLKKAAPYKSILALTVTAMVLSMLTISCTKKVSDSDTTINAVLRANVKGLDPAFASDLYSGKVIAQIYEGLLEYNYLKRPFELQPALADGMPTVSADGLTYTIKIKKGVKFHDNAAFADGKGRELKSSDFVYTFKRLADPRVASEGFWVIDGYIKGLNEWAELVKSGKADMATPVEGLQAPDDYTLVLKLTKPYFQIFYVLAMPPTMVVPHEAVEKYQAEFLNNPVGTGPFLLEKASDWVRNSKITLKKNPNWRGETYPSEGAPGDRENGLLADAGKPLPFAEKLVFSELPEDQPRWQNFMKGHFEFVEIPNDNFDSAVNKNNIKEVAPELAAKGISLQITPNSDVGYFGFNMKDSVVGKNKNLRHALAYAFDAKTMIDKFYNGRGEISHGPVPPGIDSYDSHYVNPYQSHDLTKAKEALAKAGFPEGKGLGELSFDCLSDAKSRQNAEFFASLMEKIGVKIAINPSTWPQFQQKLKDGKTQIFQVAWGADYPDAQNFFQLFYSRNVSPGPNDSSYTSAEFDKLYEKALTLPPGSERTAIYKEIRDLVNEDSPWIYGLHRVGYYVSHGWLNNLKYNDIQLDLFKYLRVDPKKRAELAPEL